MRPLAALVLAVTLAGGALAGCSRNGTDVDAASRTAALSSVQDDIETAAPALEKFYRGTSYPADLAEATATLEEAGIELSAGNSIGGYRFDTDATEFTVCIENEFGPWATYDTAPMSMREGGETGGCPYDLSGSSSVPKRRSRAAHDRMARNR
ncbi:MAG: hypothetical protein WCB95_07975 [Aeromicrobium sp.]